METIFLKALADDTRLRIVYILFNGEFTVMELMQILRMGQSRVSRHLRILTDAEITSFRREGTWVYYRLQPSSSHYQKMINCVLEWLRDDIEITQYREAIATVFDSRRKRVRRYFAQNEDKGEHYLRPYIDPEIFRHVLKGFAEGSQLIAELGCGNGENLLELATHHNQIIGVDNSEAMLKKTSDRLKSILGKPMDLRLGNLEHLPLMNQEVDGVLVSMVLHHLAHPSGVFCEFYRVLKPGGKLLIVDFSKHDDELMRNDMADLWLGFTENEIETWLTTAGFIQTRFEFISDKDSEKTVFTALSQKPKTSNIRSNNNGG